MHFFHIGQKVRHREGTQLMSVYEFEMKRDRPKAWMGLRKVGPPKYTGKIYCKWLDKNNMPQTALFDESDLVVAETVRS